jgi:hypothetical protein
LPKRYTAWWKGSRVERFQNIHFEEKYIYRYPLRIWEGGCDMETPEIEFLLYLLSRYINNNDLNPAQLTVDELMENINLNLTPIGGG